MTKKHDVIVVGGGPSGLNVSRRLAERGLDVLVLERKKEIGTHIVCTGVLGKEIFKEFDLAPDSILKEIMNVKIVSPQGNTITYQHPASFACVVDREKFDKLLADEARSKGVEFELGNRVIDVFVNKSDVEVVARTGDNNPRKFRSQIVVLATGIDHHLNKRLGLGYPKDFLNGAQAELEIEDGQATTVFIGKNFAQGAFAWAVPTNCQKVRLGLLTEKDPKVCFEHLLEKFFPEKKKNLEEKQVQIKAIAQGLISRSYGERVIALGEAAGQVKTTTGGGIYFGLLSSEFASEVILRSYEFGSFRSSLLSEYEKLWKRALEKEILVGYYTRKIWARLTDLQVERMFQIAQNDGIIPLVKDKANFDWHSGFILALIKKLPFFKIFREIPEKLWFSE